MNIDDYRKMLKREVLMKNFKIILLVLMFACFITASCVSEKGVQEEQINKLTQQEIDDGWLLLFDGETSTGWRGYNKENFPDAGWEIVDGTIHCIGSGRGEAGHGGDIITEKIYKNFELKLEWKISEGGNSGIFYMGKEKKDQPIWQSAPEMQILDNERHPDAKKGKDGNRQAGALYDLIPAKPQNSKHAGEWNKIKIYVNEGLVEHWQNGETVLEYHLWTLDWKNMVKESKFSVYPDFGEYQEGHIGLQDHGNDVWFRNIKMKEL